MDGWNTTFLLGRPIFRGENVSFREFTLSHSSASEHVVVTELLQRWAFEAATQPSNNNNNNNNKSPGNHSSQHVEDPITKKNTVQNIIWMVILLKTHQRHFQHPKTCTHRFDPPGHLVFPQPDTASREATKTQLQSWITWNSQFPGWSLRRNINLNQPIFFEFLRVEFCRSKIGTNYISCRKTLEDFTRVIFFHQKSEVRLWLGFTSFIVSLKGKGFNHHPNFGSAMFWKCWKSGLPGFIHITYERKCFSEVHLLDLPPIRHINAHEDL